MIKHKNSLLEHARLYLSKGFSIIPVGPDKRPVINSWLEFQNRYPTDGELVSWFSEDSKATGIAIVTGKISNLAVIDFEKDAKIFELPDTVTVRTGGGGYHYYFRYPENYNLGNKIRHWELTDIKGEGGYVLAPPSLHSSGNYYEWEISLESIEITPFPEHIINLIKDKEYTAMVKPDIQGIIAGVGEGNRNQSATMLVGKLLHHLPQAEWSSVVWPLLQVWNVQNNPPLPEGELSTVFKSIATKELLKRGNNQQGQSVRLPAPVHISSVLQEPDEQPEWLVEGLLPAGLTIMSGDPKSFKTWTALHVAHCVTSGNKVFGQFKAVKGNTLIIDEEDSKIILKPRLKKLSIQQDQNLFLWIMTGFKADNAVHIEQLLEFVHEQKIKLVCLDSFRRIQSKEENDARQVAEVFDSLRKVTNLNTSVILTHHHRKENRNNKNTHDQNIRGSSDILASVDCHIVVQRNSQDKILTITQNKLRIGEEIEPFQVQILEEDEQLLFEFAGLAPDRQAKKDQAKTMIITYLVDGEKTRAQINQRIKGEIGANAIGDALKELVVEGLIIERLVEKGKKIYAISTKPIESN